MPGQEMISLSGHNACYKIFAAIHLPRCLLINRDSMNITPILRIWSTIAQFISGVTKVSIRSEEHTSELQSRGHLVCRLLLEKKKTVVGDGQQRGRGDPLREVGVEVL